MTHPQHAIKSMEEMKALIGKPIYLYLKRPREISSYSFLKEKGLLVHNNILKVTLKDICHRDRTGNLAVCTEELIYAGESHAIITKKDYHVVWGQDEGNYYFPNFWVAYMHAWREGQGLKK